MHAGGARAAGMPMAGTHADGDARYPGGIDLLAHFDWTRYTVLVHQLLVVMSLLTNVSN